MIDQKELKRHMRYDPITGHFWVGAMHIMVRTQKAGKKVITYFNTPYQQI